MINGLRDKGYAIIQEYIVEEAEVQKYMFTYHTEGQFHFMFILYL